MRSNTAPAWLVLVICCVTVGRAALSFCLLSAWGRQHAVAKRFNMAAAVGALAHVLQMACCRASVQISLPLAPPRVCCNDVYHGLPPCRLPPGFATRGPAIISVSPWPKGASLRAVLNAYARWLCAVATLIRPTSSGVGNCWPFMNCCAVRHGKSHGKS